MSKNKHSIFYGIAILFIALFFSYSLVFALTENKSYNFSFSSNNIFLDSSDLNSNFFLVQKDFKNFEIKGDCSLFGKLVGSKGDYSLFKLKVLDYSCKKKKIKAYLDFDGYKKEKEFNLITSYDLYSVNLDKSDEILEKMINFIDLKLKKEKKGVLDIKLKRKTQELKYIRKFLFNILEKRKEKYKIPVLGSKMPTKLSKIPNAGRPYRSSYTDGIHHGWDFDAKKGDSVLSIDDGIVVRVVDGFLFSDLGNIKKGNNLTNDDEIMNLDILRGNQVWIKTMKGEVAFYSHLDTIFPDIKKGMFVSRGQPLGTVGSTGVPDKNYNDFHLHLPIHKNPYLVSKEGKNTYLDYMNWPWIFKGKNLDYTLKNQDKIFK